MDFSYLDVLLDAIFIFKNDKSCIYCNEAAAQLCGSSVKRLTKGRPLHEFIIFEDNNLFVMPSGRLGEEEVFLLSEVNYQLVQPNKKTGRVQVSISPFKNSEENLWIMVVRDVTVEQLLHEKYKEQLEQLESYSKNLEKMVGERTKELKTANSMLNAVMNSLGQGFLVFDESGTCLDVYTKACEAILEEIPLGKNISSILFKSECSEKEQFEMWMKAVFSDSLPFESLRELAPQIYCHSQNKHITLDFFALKNEGPNIQNLVLVATDKTSEKEVQLALNKEKDRAKMIVTLVANQKSFATFMVGLSKQIGYLEKQIDSSKVSLDEIFRILHTIEGEAATFHIAEIKNAAKMVQDTINFSRQEMHTTLDACRKEYTFAISQLNEIVVSFKNDNRTLLETLNIHEELNVIQIDRQKLMEFYQLLNHAELKEKFLDDFYKTKVRDEISLANSVLAQVAEKQGKKISSVTISGGDIKINPDWMSGLFSSFVHIYRNIVDHGLENPEERFDVGKPETGNVKIEFLELTHNRSPFLQIKISDDGRGVDPEKIRSKLKDTAPIKDWDLISDYDVIQEIFNPGFSSKEKAGEFSGRGVGMDVVKTEVLKLGGKVEVFSQLGKGTTIMIEVPMQKTDKLYRSA